VWPSVPVAVHDQSVEPTFGHALPGAREAVGETSAELPDVVQWVNQSQGRRQFAVEGFSYAQSVALARLVGKQMSLPERMSCGCLTVTLRPDAGVPAGRARLSY